MRDLEGSKPKVSPAKTEGVMVTLCIHRRRASALGADHAHFRHVVSGPSHGCVMEQRVTAGVCFQTPHGDHVMRREEQLRDPYQTEHAPRSKSGPVLRFGIVAVLLGAAAVFGYSAMTGGPTLTEAQQEETTTLADASQDTGYAASTAEIPAEPAPVAEPAAPTPAPAPARRVAPAPAPETAPQVEDVPPPSTVTVPSTPSTSGE